MYIAKRLYMAVATLIHAVVIEEQVIYMLGGSRYAKLYAFCTVTVIFVMRRFWFGWCIEHYRRVL